MTERLEPQAGRVRLGVDDPDHDHARFPSPRAALAHMFACRRGPGMRSPKLGTPIQGSRPIYDEHAAHAIAAIVKGELGVVEGSPMWRELRLWSTEKVPRSPKVEAVYRRLMRAMRRHDLLVDRARPDENRVWHWTDAEGREFGQIVNGSDPLATEDVEPVSDDTKNSLTNVPGSAPE